jgi:ATP-dependent protease ClpP protease subunit
MGMIVGCTLKETLVTEWTLYGSINDYSDYKELILALKEARDGDSIELRINCPGGDTSVGAMIIQAIRQSKAVVVCNVVYPSHSMGALIAIAGHYLIMQKHSFIMFHTYSCMTGGKSPDLIKDVHYMDKALKGMTNDLCYPFLRSLPMILLCQLDLRGIIKMYR